METERFIADDRGVWEEIQRIKAMSDEEAAAYLKQLEEKKERRAKETETKDRCDHVE